MLIVLLVHIDQEIYSRQKTELIHAFIQQTIQKLSSRTEHQTLRKKERRIKLED